MAQYIDKDALVAEIERQIELGKFKCQQSQKNNDYESYVAWSEHIATCGKILSFINTLEVKKVDSLTSEEIKKICTIYDNLNQERNRGAVLYNSDETFFNHVLMEYKVIAQKGE